MGKTWYLLWYEPARLLFNRVKISPGIPQRMRVWRQLQRLLYKRLESNRKMCFLRLGFYIIRFISPFLSWHSYRIFLTTSVCVPFEVQLYSVGNMHNAAYTGSDHRIVISNFFERLCRCVLPQFACVVRII